MPASKYNRRLCEICGRKDFNARMLGPLLHTTTISAHFNCVLFSAQTPDTTSIAAQPEDDAIAGVTSRFIRSVGTHAKKLVIFFICSILFSTSEISHFLSRFSLFHFCQRCDFCKRNGANTGCCFDIGTDDVVRFCPKQYHVDCGLQGGASFNVSDGRGTVSICYEHRDHIER